MEWACSAGCTACFALLRIAALLAGIAFSRFGFTAALYPRSSLWSRKRIRIPYPNSPVFSSTPFGKRKVDFHRVKRIITNGDGVRLTTAVLLAGQMMTPDKFLVAEPCPPAMNRSSQGNVFCVRRAGRERFPRFRTDPGFLCKRLARNI